MRLLYVLNSMEIGGIETNQLRLTRSLVERGHSVTVMSSGGVLADELIQSGGRHVGSPVSLRDPRGLLESRSRLRRLLREEPFDIVHAMSAAANLVASLAEMPSRPWRHIVSPMGLQNSDREMQTTTDLRNRLIAWRADRILVISPAIEAALRRIGVPASRMRQVDVVGLDEASFAVSEDLRVATRLQLNVDAHDAVVTTIGSLHRRKSPELFLRAAAMVIERRPATVFVFVGAGPELPRLRRAASDRGIAERVRFTGNLRDVRGILSASDVYVKPGVVEGFIGITVLEAMAAARPVIAFDTQDVRVAIADGTTGLIAERGNARHLADLIFSLLEDPARALRVGGNGLALVRARFTIGSVADRLEQAYRAMLDG